METEDSCSLKDVIILFKTVNRYKINKYPLRRKITEFNQLF